MKNDRNPEKTIPLEEAIALLEMASYLSINGETPQNHILHPGLKEIREADGPDDTFLVCDPDDDNWRFTFSAGRNKEVGVNQDGELLLWFEEDQDEAPEDRIQARVRLLITLKA